MEGSDFQYDRETKRHESELGTLTVHTTKRRRMIESDRKQNTSGQSHRYLCDLIAKAHFLPRRSPQSALIIATIQQYEHLNGVFSMTPSLRIDPVLTDDSPIFSLVENGCVDAFLDIIKKKEFLWRARNQKGGSLLHVSHFQSAFELFRFDSIDG